MLALPVEVLCGGILPLLSVCDLQALDTAFTNKYLRPQLRQVVWESYQYDTLDVKVVEYEVSWLCNVGVRIKSVSIKRMIRESESLVSNIPTLKRLNINNAFDTLFFKLATNCLGLEELYVSDFYGSNIDNAVSALANNCHQLHTLKINSYHLTNAGITAVTQLCSQLSVFRICRSEVTDAGVQALCDTCPHLKHIELSNCYLTDASLIAIANSYPHLQIIRLYSYYFTNEGLIYFADKCQELRSVSVRCNKITNRGLTALWAANPNLMDVDISYNDLISDDAIIQLVQCCPLLQKLSMWQRREITDAAVIAVAEHCPQLKLLNISECHEVTDASLIALGQHCHKLKSIDISRLKNISDVGIAVLAASCPLLQEFYAGQTNITDGDVVALARGCRDLRKVDLYLCKSIGITAISAIAQNCQLVSELVISYCMIDDACLYIIAQHCSNLTTLQVDHTKVSTAAAIVSVIRSCQFLRELRCNNCVMNDENAKNTLGKLASRLHVFEV